MSNGLRLTQAEYAKRRLQRPDIFPALDSRPADQPVQPPRLARDQPRQPARQTRHRGVPVVRCLLIAAVPRRIDPGNLAVAFKAHQDAIAAALGIDDGDQRIAWEYEQIETRGPSGVIVKLTLE